MTARLSPAVSVVCCGMARTPIGRFGGSLSSKTGSELGALAIRGALHDDVKPRKPFSVMSCRPEWDKHLVRVVQESDDIDDCVFNTFSPQLCHNIAWQAVLGAGLPSSTVCTTINKVCASGMKAVQLAQQSLLVTAATSSLSSKGDNLWRLAGGFESMSNVPHFLRHRQNKSALGHATLQDGIIHDGLWDAYHNQHMGQLADQAASTMELDRSQQDAYALESYRRAVAAPSDDCIVPVLIDEKTTVTADEEVAVMTNEKLAKLPELSTVFGDSITAGNSSSLNDGACALLLTTCDNAPLSTPYFRILGTGDAAKDPVDYPVAPAAAVQVAVTNAGLQLEDVEYHEINEAFAVVALANMELLGLDHDRVNVHGGAVALGHPIGMSGARILTTLYQVLKVKDATIGCASICNGGGGATAIVIERLK